MHEDDVPTSRKIFMDLVKGQDPKTVKYPFPGLYKYVNLIVSHPKELTIIFKDRENPIPVLYTPFIRPERMMIKV
jgi:hypothetical protein